MSLFCSFSCYRDLVPFSVLFLLPLLLFCFIFVRLLSSFFFLSLLSLLLLLFIIIIIIVVLILILFLLLHQAICDFIADMMLCNQLLTSQVVAAVFSATLFLRKSSEGHEVASAVISKIDLFLREFLKNIEVLFSSRMPRRRNSTFLIEAAASGNEPLVRAILSTLWFISPSGSMFESVGADVSGSIKNATRTLGPIVDHWNKMGIELKEQSEISLLDFSDDENQTALFRASEIGDAQIVSLLMKCGADPGIRPKLLPQLVTLRGSEPGCKCGDQKLESQKIKVGSKVDESLCFVAGVPSAAASFKCRAQSAFYFEVEIGTRWIGPRARLVVGFTGDKRRSKP